MVNGIKRVGGACLLLVIVACSGVDTAGTPIEARSQDEWLVANLSGVTELGSVAIGDNGIIVGGSKDELPRPGSQSTDRAGRKSVSMVRKPPP